MTARGRLVALEGPSGAGKTTVARAVARALEGVAVAEAFDRLSPRPSLRYRTDRQLLATERRLLSEERRRYRVATELVRAGRTVVADTGFLGPLTYTAGLVALKEASAETFLRLRAAAERPGRSEPPRLPDLTLYLDVPARLRAKRVARDPTGHPAELIARHERVGRFERRYFLELLSTVDPGRVVRLRATGSPATVVRRVRTAVLRSLPARRRPPPAGPALAALAALLRQSRSGRRRAGSAASVKKVARSGRAPHR